MTRLQVLASARAMGYHDDLSAFTRLRIECNPRVALDKLISEYHTGIRAKKIGMLCGCHECKTVPQSATP